MTAEQLLAMMKKEIRPAIGCTEPVAVAFAAAEAADLLDAEIDRLVVKVDPNIFKNGMGVYVPGTDKMGLGFAAALGAVAGDASLELEVLKNIGPLAGEKAQQMLSQGRVTVSYIPDHIGVYIEVEAGSGTNSATVIIKDSHTNIVFKKINDTVIYELGAGGKRTETDTSQFQSLSIKEIIRLVDSLDREDLGFMETVISHNREIAERGLCQPLGMGVGHAWQKMMDQGVIPRDWFNVAKAYTAGATDARMSGQNLAVMSCAGSGNQGLMASLPVIIAADFLKVEKQLLHKALGLSFSTTIYAKTFIGRLSALCGCAIAASLGAGVGIAYLMNMNSDEIEGVIKNLAGDIPGVICDGAKPGCSLKLMTAVDAACQMVMLVRNGVIINAESGIVRHSAEQTIRNVGRLSKPGMLETDKTILDIMIGQPADKLTG